MRSWIPYVFVRVVLFFVAGILCALYLPKIIPYDLAVTLLLLISFLFITLGILVWKKKIQLNIGFVGLPVLFLSGYLHLYHQTELNDHQHFTFITDPIEFYEVELNSEPEEKAKSWKVEGSVHSVYAQGQWAPVTGKVLLYFSKEKFTYQYNDRLILSGSPSMLEPPANPGEFDYKRFLSFKNIYHQHFINDSAIHVSCTNPYSLMYYALQCRAWAKNKLAQFIDSPAEFSIAAALVLGIKDGLDNELIQSYAASGAMHVLAVSGLHVGIIYWILLILLRPVSKMKSGPWLIAFISIVVLWTYAFMTGLSPSVLRAVTMFSFVAFARPLKYSTNIYNTLAASAFCLLIYNPYLIMSVGFQLSYAAVLGIVYLQPKLYQIWNPNLLWVDKVWQITTVSVAAQVATFTLGLLYFHQFPVYFLVSNLFVIPGAVAILSGGLLLLAIHFITPAAEIIGLALKYLIVLLNHGVAQVEALPFSLIEGVHITTAQCWLLILTIFFFLILFEYKKFKYLLLSFLVVTVFTVMQWQHFLAERNEPKITVYKVTGHRAIDLIDGGTSFFLGDSVLQQDQERMKFHIRPNRLLCGTTKTEDVLSQAFYSQVQGGDMICWNGVTLLLIDSPDYSVHPSLPVDYVIVSKNAIRDSAKLLTFNCKKIILDSSNSYYLVDRMMQEFGYSHGKIYSVQHQGSFTITFTKHDIT
jgi:competence protein ComEC